MARTERSLQSTDGAIVERTVNIGYCHHCDWYCTKETWGSADEALDDHLATSHDIAEAEQRVI